MKEGENERLELLEWHGHRVSEPLIQMLLFGLERKQVTTALLGLDFQALRWERGNVCTHTHILYAHSPLLYECQACA